MSQRIFEALASPIRRQIVVELAAGELNAGEIAARFELSKPAISQHLTVLEAAGLVSRRKKGQFVYYAGDAAVLSRALEDLLAQVRPAPQPAAVAPPKPAESSLLTLPMAAAPALPKESELFTIPIGPRPAPPKPVSTPTPVGYRWEAWRSGID